MTEPRTPVMPAPVMPAIGGSRTLEEAERLAEELANPKPAPAPAVEPGAEQPEGSAPAQPASAEE